MLNRNNYVERTKSGIAFCGRDSSGYPFQSCSAEPDNSGKIVVDSPVTKKPWERFGFLTAAQINYGVETYIIPKVFYTYYIYSRKVIIRVCLQRHPKLPANDQAS